METHPMKAIQYQAYGSYEENRLVEVDRPKPKDGEVLVKMSTVGINPLDNTFRSGHIYLATPAPGLLPHNQFSCCRTACVLDRSQEGHLRWKVRRLGSLSRPDHPLPDFVVRQNHGR